MRVIVIEDRVYKVSEKVFKLLRDKQEELENKDFERGSDLDFHNYIEGLKDQFKFVGVIQFDFRL